jgi:glutathione synthase/RimK-type ligase-like ATP-grasp enzyme
VPSTLVTNDPAAVRAFLAEHGELIYKSASGIRSIVRRVEPNHVPRLALLRNGPTQFQAFIPGCNVRVHVVGERLFATRVRSAAVDYRYAGREGASVEMEPAELPPAVAAACLAVSRDLGLLHAGIDLKETPDGEWYCFEVNPCPGFIFYERSSGQPISLALAKLLHAGTTSDSRGASGPPIPAFEQAASASA